MPDTNAKIAKRQAVEFVRNDEFYTLKEVQRRLGFGDVTMRTLRRRGFPLIRIGKRSYASGRQVIAFLESMGGDADAG